MRLIGSFVAALIIVRNLGAILAVIVVALLVFAILFST